MCGINGLIGFEDTQKAQTVVSLMNRSLTHRGPDDNGIYSYNNTCLGHQRLAIIDLSKHAHQPMLSTDENCSLVYNGEIYNFKEIKQELQEYSFQSDSDTEVILAAYQKWGMACLEKLNGMFAFALHDKSLNKLFIVRDRLGIKPLYYSHQNNFFIFSSEIRSLLASNLTPKQLNRACLTEYLSFQTVHAPNTLVDGVKLLEAGHFLELDVLTLKSKKISWWNLPTEAIEISHTEAQNKTKELLYSAVDQRLVSDVPFGAFLSGGIDSSAIVGAMADLSSKPVETFNISFDEEEFSEAKYARIIAKLNNTHHHEIKLTPGDFLQHLPDALNAIDHPSGDGPNTWVVSKAIKDQGITMALSGLGGDELFAGYAIFERMKKLQKHRYLWQLPLPLRNFIGSLLSKFKPSVASKKIEEILRHEEFNFSSIHATSRKVLLNQQIEQLLKPTHETFEFIDDIFSGSETIFSHTSRCEINTYMQAVLLRDCDQMSMAHSLELRVPFLDHRLVEFALSIPDHLKPYGKKLLINSMKDKLPDAIVNRPKMGFVFPWQKWLKNELFSFTETHIKSLNKKAYFRENSVLQLWQQFLNNDPNVTYSRIWPLIVLNHWMERNDIV